jgi:aspartate dehydrogenase
MPAGTGALLRVGLLGYGSIGAAVAGALRAGEVPGAVLTAVARRTGPGCAESVSVSELPDRCDLLVEAAGQAAVEAHAATVLDRGVDLLVVSTGALADERLRTVLAASGPGRLLISSGAIGGIDLLRAASRAGPVSVRLTSVKAPGSLIRPWMPADLVASLRAGLPDDDETVVFDGGASEAAARFPTNANVAATLALAAGDWDAVTVRIVARRAATMTRHRIEIEAQTGTYLLDLRNVPLADNPASSRLVADAVLRALADAAGTSAPAFL